jgi:hypothetical protein
MKRLSLIITLLATLVFFSCEDTNLDDAIDQEFFVTSGQWNILVFFDKSGDKARNYANYNFSFAEGGIVTATRNNDIADGTWSIGEVSNKSKRMVLGFTNPDFQSLGKEWVVNEITNDKIELIRFSNEGSENLVFVRN